ncbi:hypothetical protein FBU30_005678 [Linnemannia zychae]|nr:hypothetical protein FBU30_005678 [Linnemannia zychae]
MDSNENVKRDYFTLNIDKSDTETEDEEQTLTYLKQQEGTVNTTKLEGHGEVIGFAVSGNGQYIAKIIETDTLFSIELWLSGGTNFSCQYLMCHTVAKRDTLAPMVDTRNVYNISLSHNASWMSLTDATSMYLAGLKSNNPPPSMFRIFEIVTSNSMSIADRTSAETKDLHSLSNYYGFGKFHITDYENEDIKKEIFITCNGSSVQIYSINGGWKYLHTISLDHPERQFARANIAAQMIMSCKGRHFAWIIHETEIIAVYDIEKGSLVSSVIRPCIDRGRIAINTALAISENGNILAICREGTLTTHFTSNGKLHRILQLPPEFSNIYTVSFGSSQSQIKVRLWPKESPTQETRGLLINARKLSIEKTFTSPPVTDPIQLLQDTDTTTPYLPITTCDVECNFATSPLSLRSKEVTIYDLNFKVELRSIGVVHSWEPREPRSAIVTMTSLNTLYSKIFTIPPACSHQDWWLYNSAVFLQGPGQLVVEGEGVILIWKLPTSYNGDFTLILAYVIAPKYPEWFICPHDHLYYRERIDITRANTSNNGKILKRIPIELQDVEVGPFLMGLDVAIYMSLEAKVTFKSAVFRYAGLCMNTEINNVNAFAEAIDNWAPENYETLEKFMLTFLDSPSGVMHPIVKSINFIHIIIKNGRANQRSINLVRVLIDKCIRQARAAKDSKYLCQVTESLPELLDPKQLHSVIALSTLRQLAYFPINDRELIINHHTIAYPPSFRLWPWRKQARPLYKCKDPILQLSKARIHDPQNDNFTRELFIASFDILWEVQCEDTASDTALLFAVVSQAYNSNLQSSKALYITIISCSSSFNMPETATDTAICQLCILNGLYPSDDVAMQLNAGFFGFSVPLVSLHFLFELRVLTAVSQFVVIITQIISRIRIITFTIAITHMLFSCPIKNTEKCVPTTDFPTHFFKAFTVTYFLMH